MTRRGRPTRRSSLKDTRRQLLLFVEGRRTEPGYLQHYEDATKRAQALEGKHAKDGSPPRSNPSSDVWRLIERIRNPPV